MECEGPALNALLSAGYKALLQCFCSCSLAEGVYLAEIVDFPISAE